MLQDGLTLTDTSVATNFQIQRGATLPTEGNNEGELFYLTSGVIGLYIYSGTVWEVVSKGSTPAGINVTGYSEPAVT